MIRSSLADALTDLRRRATSGGDALPDGELLRRYSDARDQDAFAALVRRHGRVVWGAALRRTADRQLAEDVFQATFLALARRAGRLHGRTSLAGWLYTVGLRFAHKAARRPRPATLDHVPDPQPGPLADLSARDLLATIDDELGRLPERLRLPVVLCCLDGLSRDEAAIRLGCTFQVLKGRLERGRELLRKRLAARGVSLSAALGGLVVLPIAVPPEVSAATASAVVQGTPRPAATALVKTLVRGRASGVATLAIIGLIGLGLSLMPGGDPPKPDTKPPAKDPDAAAAGETVTIRVLRDGKPAAGAKIWVSPWGTNDKPDLFTADGDGRARIPFTADGRNSLKLFARDAEGRIGMLHVYDNVLLAEPQPSVHLVEVGELTGRFLTTDGKPIVGVEVHAWQFNRPDNEHEAARPNYIDVPQWDSTYTVKTDVDGKFRITGAPVGYRAYADVKTNGYGQGFIQPEAGKPLEVKLAPAGILRVKLSGPGDVAATKGLMWNIGAARDPGKGGPSFFPRTEGRFDGSAEFQIPNLCPGRYRVHLWSSASNAAQVIASMPEDIRVVSGSITELSLGVQPMAKATGRLVDAATGKGIPGVVFYMNLRGDARKGTQHDGRVETDAEGKFVAYGPPGEWIEPQVYNPPPGYAAAESGEKWSAKLDLKTPHNFPDMKFRKTVSLNGLVVDEAGKPVAAPSVRPARMNMRQETPDTISGKPDGAFTIANLDPEDVIAPRIRKGNAVNVPAPIEVGKQDGPARIEISEKNACRVRGRVTDAAGKPLVGATVGVSWHYHGLGREASYGTSRGAETLATDADGKFQSGGLWPKDSYSVTVRHEGYGRSESKQVTGEAGKVHDLGTITLVSSGLTVRGRVVGLDGQPIAGVTVFNRGDGPAAMSTTSGADGSFQLKGFFDAPGFVFAKMDGYRFAYAVARPGGEPVTVTLRKTSEPPVPLASLDEYNAALAKFTRQFLETLWAERDHMGGYGGNVFRAMAKFDPATAAKWRDEVKTRSKGKTDYTKMLNEAERDRTLLKTAREDVDEALALIPTGKDRWVVQQLITLGEELLAHDKAKALRVAEEAAVRVRALDPNERALLLAKAGNLAVKAGNETGGKKLLAEAAELAGNFGKDERRNYYRGLTAAELVVHDEPTAHKLIDAIADQRQYNRALALVIDRLAESNPKRAEELIGKFHHIDGYYDVHYARLALAFQLAQSDPDRAERLIGEIPKATMKSLGLARLATKVKDRERAWKLIEQSFAVIDAGGDDLRSWGNHGGAPAIAALAAVRARQVNHPDAAALIGRALALREPQRTWTSRQEREEQLVSVATVLAFADPPTARAVLAGIGTPAEFAKRAASERREWVFAAAFADPDGAMAVMESVWKAAKARRGGAEATSGTGLIELTGILTDPGDRMALLARYASIPSIPDRAE